MKITEKEYKKLKKLNTKTNQTKKKTTENLPTWFKEEPNKEQASTEEIEEMEDILKELV